METKEQKQLRKAVKDKGGIGPYFKDLFKESKPKKK